MVAETEGKLSTLARASDDLLGCSNPTPWNTPSEMDDDEMEQRIEKLAAGVDRPERADIQPACPSARTPIDLAPELDAS